MDEDAKRIILARRARFVAAALASLGVATHACGGRSEGDNTSAGGGTSATASGGDGGTEGSGDAGAAGASGAENDGSGGSIVIGGGAAGVAGVAGEPLPCLSPAR